MGKEKATTMSLLPPVGWCDVATRRDLGQLEERLDGKIDLVAQRLDARIDRIKVRLDAMTSAMGGMGTKADLTESRVELQRTLVTWIFMSQVTVVAAIGVLPAFLR
jgi:hypothetical protein